MNWIAKLAKPCNENFPPSFQHEPIKKQISVNRCNPLIIRSKWTNEASEESMDVIENGIT